MKIAAFLSILATGLVLCCLLAGCAGGAGGSDPSNLRTPEGSNLTIQTNTISITVVDGDTYQPIEKALVKLLVSYADTGAVDREGTTGADGNVSFGYTCLGNFWFEIRAEAAGYETGTLPVRLHGEAYTVSIPLKPIPK